MNKKIVVEAVKNIKNQCSTTSCDECCFTNYKGNCVLTEELMGAPSDYEVENLGIDDFSSKKREIFNTIFVDNDKKKKAA